MIRQEIAEARELQDKISLLLKEHGSELGPYKRAQCVKMSKDLRTQILQRDRTYQSRTVHAKDIGQIGERTEGPVVRDAAVLSGIRREAWQDVTPSQLRYVNAHYNEGKTMTEIAAEFGVNSSTVSRSLERARRHVRRYSTQCADARKAFEPYRENRCQETLEPLLAAAGCTDAQARYLIPRYIRFMTIPDIAAEFGVNASTVSRTIRRGERQLEKVLGGLWVRKI